MKLPVIKNAGAEKFGYSTKLIPVFLDGVQNAWEEIHINSKLTETRRDSPEAIRAAGFAAPFVDYDPIMEMK